MAFPNVYKLRYLYSFHTTSLREKVQYKVRYIKMAAGPNPGKVEKCVV